MVWNGFFSKSSLTNIISANRRIAQLETEREQYRKRIVEDSLFIEQLKEPEFLERFARENLYMLREGEQIYIIEE